MLKQSSFLDRWQSCFCREMGKVKVPSTRIPDFLRSVSKSIRNDTSGMTFPVDQWARRMGLRCNYQVVLIGFGNLASTYPLGRLWSGGIQDIGIFNGLVKIPGVISAVSDSAGSLLGEARLEGKVDFKPVSLKNPLLFGLSSIRMYRLRNWMFYSNGRMKEYAGVSPV